MKSKITLIILLLFLVIISKQCLTVGCSSGCSCCSQDYYCDTCLLGYTPETSWEWVSILGSLSWQLTRYCQSCSDSHCVSCSLTPEVCHVCTSGYGRSLQVDYRCDYCTTSIANACSTVNNCNAANNCAICPMYYLDSVTNNCMPCNTKYRNCAECNANTCTRCNNYYYLNTSNSRQCVRCTLPNCKYCSDGPVCTSCIEGYYLDNNDRCQSCTDPCVACSSSTCYACNLAGNVYTLVGGSCQLCDYLFPNCKTCWQTNAGNSTSMDCYSCLDGWYFSGGSCFSCTSPCSTCSSASTCLTCIDKAHYLNSGSCSLCSSAINHCTECVSSTACVICDYGYIVVLKGSNCTACDQILMGCENCTITQCLVCQAGYYLLNGTCFLNTNCTSNCRSCEVSFPTSCVTCFPGEYLLPGPKTCQTCPATCVTCLYNANTLTVQCLKCSYGKYLNSGVCDPCNNGTYYLNTVHNCVNCSAYCLTCTVKQCSTCESSLFYVSTVTGKCEDLCGDGYVVTLPCDGGAGIANDGCAQDCTIEPSYTCTSTPTTNPVSGSTTVVMKSQCTYTGQPTLQIYKAVQSKFSNYLTLVFRVKPYLSGLPNGTEGQTVLRSIFQLTPLDQLTDYAISVDSSQETVSFHISYSVDIDTNLLNFNVNFASLSSNPMFQSQSNQAATFQMESILGSSRLGQYHEESQYTGNKALFVLSAIISGISYLTLIIGVLSRQLAGLEHMQLCQTIYLLVLFRPQNNFYLQGLLGFKYSVSADIFNSEVGGIQSSPSYIYNINTNSFVNNFNINFLLVIIPTILSFIFMLYRIKIKHIPAKKDFAKSASQLLIGQFLLYFVMYNLLGLVAYSYLYLHSNSEGQITNTIFMATAGLFTLFAIANLFLRPQIVGVFRYAFSSYKMYNFHEPKEGRVSKKFEECISWRYKGEEWKEGYRKISINFYFVSLGYQILSVGLIICQLTVVLICVQFLVLILLFAVKPYLKPIQKFRALLTYFILIFASLTSLVPTTNAAMPAILIVLVFSHLILVSFIVAKGSYFQIMKRCTERQQMVRQMFKEDREAVENQMDEQLQVVDKLVKQYHKLGITQKLQPYQREKNNQTLALREQVEEPKEDLDIKDEISDNQNIITEDRILGEENKHLRYIDGMKFMHKYGFEVNQDIVKDHYKGI